MVEALAFLTRANLAAAAAILLVLALRGPARALFGARTAYGLWSLPVLVTVAVILPARVLPIALPPAPPAMVPFDPTSAVPLTMSITAPGAGVDVTSLLIILWAVGVVAAFLILARTQRRFTSEAAGGRLGPAVVGVLAPRILKPRDFEQRFTRAERRLVLAHERAHIARQDSRINGLVVLVQCLFWFNPLIHLGAHILRIDQELACDEVVISRFPRARTLYARALMKAQLAIRPLPLGCYWPSRTRHPLLERVNMITRDEFSRARRLAGASMLAVLCGAAGFAAWAAQPPVVKLIPAPTDLAASVAKAPTREAQPPAPRPRPAAPKAAEPAPAPVPPADVCLTNACSKPGEASVARDDAAIAAAIAAGVPGDLIRAGGTPTEAWAAYLARCARLASPACKGPIPGTEQWGRFPEGGIALMGSAVGPTGLTGEIYLRTPDMLGIPAPDGAPTMKPAGPPEGAPR